MSEILSIDRNSLLKRVKDDLLPQPVTEGSRLDGVIVLVGGDPGEVIVRITGSRVTVAIFTAGWEGPHTPVVHPKVLGTLYWRRLPASQMIRALDDLITTARDIRRAKYRKCERCGETNPPEWMDGATICQSCAEKHLGIVY